MMILLGDLRRVIREEVDCFIQSSADMIGGGNISKRSQFVGHNLEDESTISHEEEQEISLPITQQHSRNIGGRKSSDL